MVKNNVSLHINYAKIPPIYILGTIHSFIYQKGHDCIIKIIPPLMKLNTLFSAYLDEIIRFIKIKFI